MSRAKCLKCKYYIVTCTYIEIGVIKHPNIEWKCKLLLNPQNCSKFESR